MGESDFVYVHSDIPEGMTIREWRAQRAAERAEQRALERGRRRARGGALLSAPLRFVVASCKKPRAFAGVKARAFRQTPRAAG